jgi:hypothetical protein
MTGAVRSGVGTACGDHAGLDGDGEPAYAPPPPAAAGPPLPDAPPRLAPRPLARSTAAWLWNDVRRLEDCAPENEKVGESARSSRSTVAAGRLRT